MIAYGFASIEHRRALLSDEVVELTVQIPTRDVLSDLAARCGAVVVQRVLRRSGASDIVFLSVSSTFATAAESLFDGHRTIESYTTTGTYDGRTGLKIAVAAPLLVLDCATSGGYPRRIEGRETGTVLIVDVPTDRDVRRFLSELSNVHPGTSLQARRVRETGLEPTASFRTVLERRLTDKQRESLETAYFGGTSSGRETTPARTSQPCWASPNRRSPDISGLQNDTCWSYCSRTIARPREVSAAGESIGIAGILTRSNSNGDSMARTERSRFNERTFDGDETTVDSRNSGGGKDRPRRPNHPEIRCWWT
ncbi:bacterio-opsin activator domain-containing protein [Haloarculaceae archaeon H-GB2-1]|nr:bacterio-opsin activator domain-containing protein [Haloarculaceae archaeon H-GB2-1]